MEDRAKKQRRGKPEDVPLHTLGQAICRSLEQQARKLASIKYQEQKVNLNTEHHEYNPAILDASWNLEAARIGLLDLCLIDPAIPLPTLIKGIKDLSSLRQVVCQVNIETANYVAGESFVIQYQPGPKYRGQFDPRKAKQCEDSEKPLSLHEALTLIAIQGKELLSYCEMIVAHGWSKDNQPFYVRICLSDRNDLLGIFPTAAGCKDNYKIGIPTKAVRL